MKRSVRGEAAGLPPALIPSSFLPPSRKGPPGDKGGRAYAGLGTFSTDPERLGASDEFSQFRMARASVYYEDAAARKVALVNKEAAAARLANQS